MIAIPEITIETPYTERKEALELEGSVRREHFMDLVLLSFYGSDIYDKLNRMNTSEKMGSYDILRIYNPNLEQRRQLACNGFIYKPSWLLWICPSYQSDEEYLAILSKKQRQRTRKAVNIVESRFKVVVEDGLEIKTIDKWYELYRNRVREMKRGLLIAEADRHVFITQPEKFVGLFIYDGSQMIGGTLCLRRNDMNMLRVVYSATDPNYMGSVELSRYLYFLLLRTARELGYSISSLGVDPNLYGHVVSVGLYSFKWRIGFRPIPAQIYGEDSSDVLERIISFS